MLFQRLTGREFITSSNNNTTSNNNASNESDKRFTLIHMKELFDTLSNWRQQLLSIDQTTEVSEDTAASSSSSVTATDNTGSQVSLKQKTETNQNTKRKLQQNDKDIIETIRELSEVVVYGDRQKGSEQLFEYFCEKNILSILVDILHNKSTSSQVQTQILQTCSILVQNVRSETSLFFILSNNYINQVIDSDLNFDEDEELLSYYISFLKTLALRLDDRTIQFFFMNKKGEISFPLYERSIQLYQHPDGMVRTAVRSITLSIFNVQDKATRKFITQSEHGLEYFDAVMKFIAQRCKKTHQSLCEFLQRAHSNAPSLPIPIIAKENQQSQDASSLPLNGNTTPPLRATEPSDSSSSSSQNESTERKASATSQNQSGPSTRLGMLASLLSSPSKLASTAMTAAAGAITSKSSIKGVNSSEQSKTMVPVDSPSNMFLKLEVSLIEIADHLFYIDDLLSVSGFEEMEIAVFNASIKHLFIPLIFEALLPESSPYGNVLDDLVEETNNHILEKKQGQFLSIVFLTQAFFSIKNPRLVRWLIETLLGTKSNNEDSNKTSGPAEINKVNEYRNSYMKLLVDEDERLSLVCACLLFAILKNSSLDFEALGNVHILPYSRRNDDKHQNYEYPEAYVDNLLSSLSRIPSNRPATLRVTAKVLIELCYDESLSKDRVDNGRKIKYLKEESVELLRHAYKSAANNMLIHLSVIAKASFISLFEDEWRIMKRGPLNVESLFSKPEILLPSYFFQNAASNPFVWDIATSKIPIGLDFRAPLSPDEDLRCAIRSFMIIRLLCANLCYEVDTLLNALGSDDVEISENRSIDLRRCEYIQVRILGEQKESRMLPAFMVIIAGALVLVEPDKTKYGQGATRSVAPLHLIEVGNDHQDTRILHLCIKSHRKIGLSRQIRLGKSSDADKSRKDRHNMDENAPVSQQWFISLLFNDIGTCHWAKDQLDRSILRSREEKYQRIRDMCSEIPDYLKPIKSSPNQLSSLSNGLSQTDIGNDNNSSSDDSERMDDKIFIDEGEEEKTDVQPDTLKEQFQETKDTNPQQLEKYNENESSDTAVNKDEVEKDENSAIKADETTILNDEDVESNNNNTTTKSTRKEATESISVEEEVFDGINVITTVEEDVQEDNDKQASEITNTGVESGDGSSIAYNLGEDIMHGMNLATKQYEIEENE